MNIMAAIVPRSEDRKRKDAEEILAKVNSNFYSISEYNKLDDSSKEEWTSKLDDIEQQIQNECPEFVLDLRSIECLITITVNELVVASCTIIKEGGLTSNPYFIIDTMCVMGSSTTSRYLLQEAERFSLYSNISFLTVDAKFHDFHDNLSLGYKPIRIQDFNTSVANKKPLMESIIEQARTQYDTKLKNQGMLQQTGKLDPDSESVMSLINGVLGEDVEMKLRNNLPGMVRHWGQIVDGRDLIPLISRNKVKMTKNLVLPPGGLDPVDTIHFQPGTIRGNLSSNIDTFMDLIQVQSYDLSNIIDRITGDEDELAKMCVNKIGSGYINQLNIQSDQVMENNTVLVTEVSSTILSFCIIKFQDYSLMVNSNGKREFGDFKPWAYISLICARQYSYIGSNMLRQSELFSARHGVKTIRLVAVTSRLGWYFKKGYRFGNIVHDNDPTKLKTKTKYYNDAMYKIVKAIEDSNNNVILEDIHSGPIQPPLTRIAVDVVKFKLEKSIRTALGETIVTDFIKRYPTTLFDIAHETLKRGNKDVIDAEWKWISGNGFDMSKNLIPDL